MPKSKYGRKNGRSKKRKSTARKGVGGRKKVRGMDFGPNPPKH